MLLIESRTSMMNSELAKSFIELVPLTRALTSLPSASVILPLPISFLTRLSTFQRRNQNHIADI